MTALFARYAGVALVALVAAGTAPDTRAADIDAQRRANMVRIIRDYESAVPFPGGQDAFDSTVLDVMGRLPRHEFVREWQRDAAYDNRPLPIGYGQTISQPFIVALMTDLLDLEPQDVALEVGTGSGYQAAVLAHLVAEVCTIEIIPQLGRAAAKSLERLGYNNVRVNVGDGYYGWPACGPFDAVVVTAAASHIPPPLIQQLKPGGRLVIPVGGPFLVQQLMLVERAMDGRITTRQILPVRFVPLRRTGS